MKKTLSGLPAPGIRPERAKIIRLKKMERNFKRLKKSLQERRQESRCLTTIIHLIERYGDDPAQALAHIIRILPSAWVVSEPMCACLELKVRVFKPEHCPGKNNVALNYSQAIGNGETSGALHCCCKQTPSKDRNPFNLKKKKFCEIIAVYVKEFLARIELKEAVLALGDKNRIVASDRQKTISGVIPLPAPIVGQSRAMREIRQILAKAAAGDSNVLIYGEPGSGKELAARTIHHLSKRSHQPFMVLDCAAVPRNLLEYDLSGRNAGTAESLPKNLGNLALAHGGTLFLDLVGELALELQARVLRLLNREELFKDFDGSIRPLDVRIIAATSRNLVMDLHTGRIRKDFFYRLHAVPIALPPLREHKEDIPLLVEHLLKLHGSSAPPGRIPQRILETLMNYHWPGNVLELKNALARYLELGMVNLTDFEDGYAKKETPGINPIDEFGALKQTLAKAEKKYILEALQKNEWNRQATADLLQITRITLFRKIKEYGLDRERGGKGKGQGKFRAEDLISEDSGMTPKTPSRGKKRMKTEG